MSGRFRALLEQGSEIVFDGGLGIAIEILGRVAGRVRGIQVAAPFGRYQAAISVLEAARKPVGTAT